MQQYETDNLQRQDDLLILGKPNTTQNEEIMELMSQQERYSSHLNQESPGLYIEQFRNSLEDIDLALFKRGSVDSSTSKESSLQNDSERPQKTRKQKQIKKVQNSPFHNYQKHLSNALKKLVIFPNISNNDDQYKKAAKYLWKIYEQGDIKNKKILSFIFNQKNQYAINESELRAYQFYEIYHRFDKKVITQAKSYLSKLAIDQLDSPNIESYLRTRKIKNKEGFKIYLLHFRKELQSGYLKRRINFEQEN